VRVVCCSSDERPEREGRGNGGGGGRAGGGRVGFRAGSRPGLMAGQYYSGDSADVSRLLDSLLRGYDQRLRPNYNGQSHF